MKKNDKKQTQTHGGARANSGRPRKIDKDIWGKVTCILRHDTIEKLREGSRSRFFGEYLQAHLDRYPPPDYETYQAMLGRKPLMVMIKRRRVPVIIGGNWVPKKRIPKPPKPLPPKLAAFEAAYNALVEKELSKSK